MRNTPIERKLIDETIEAFQIADFGKATIREVKAIAAKAEAESGIEFIKMEMGVPGLPPSAVGVKAEIEALQKGIASLYPDINGLPALKEEASRFIKAFINVDFATGRLCITCMNLYTSQTAVLVASSAHFLICGLNNSSSLSESIIA